MPNAQVCVFDGTYYKITITNYISKTSLYTTFHMYSMGTLAAENLDVCTACDPWEMYYESGRSAQEYKWTS